MPWTPTAKFRTALGVFAGTIALQVVALYSSSRGAFAVSETCRFGVGPISLIYVLGKWRWHRGSDSMDCALKGSAGTLALVIGYILLHSSSAILDFAGESLSVLGAIVALIGWGAFAQLRSDLRKEALRRKSNEARRLHSS